MPERTRICICIPLYGGVPSEWVKGLLKLAFAIQAQPSLELDIVFDDAQPLAKSRNNMLSIAAKKNPAPDFILWLDSDNLLGFEGFSRLLSDNGDMVSALYYTKKPPHHPVILKNAQAGGLKEWADVFPENSLFEADAAGLGCMLMKWQVAQRMLSLHEFPFEYLKVKGSTGSHYLSEDIVFCDRAREAGFRLHVDSRVKSGHIGGTVGGDWPKPPSSRA